MSTEQNAQPIEPASQQPSGRRFRGWRFSCLRKERGLSLQAVADKLKLSKSKYYAFERGKQDLPVKKLEKLQELFELSSEEKRDDADARSREIALASLASQPGAGLPGSSLPAFLRIAMETTEARNDRLIREHGSIENYLRISAELQAKDLRIQDLQMKIWELEAQLAQRDKREERIKKTLNAFYGET